MDTLVTARYSVDPPFGGPKGLGLAGLGFRVRFLVSLRVRVRDWPVGIAGLPGYIGVTSCGALGHVPPVDLQQLFFSCVLWPIQSDSDYMLTVASWKHPVTFVPLLRPNPGDATASEQHASIGYFAEIHEKCTVFRSANFCKEKCTWKFAGRTVYRWRAVCRWCRSRQLRCRRTPGSRSWNDLESRYQASLYHHHPWTATVQTVCHTRRTILPRDASIVRCMPRSCVCLSDCPSVCRSQAGILPKHYDMQPCTPLQCIGRHSLPLSVAW